MRIYAGVPAPDYVYQVLSLDARTGEIKNSRNFLAQSSLRVFATNDAHVIISGIQVVRLTPDLKDAGIFDYQAFGEKYALVENISPDGSTLGNAADSGFELIDAHTLKATKLKLSLTADEVSSKAVLSASEWWDGIDHDPERFVTLADANGRRLIFHRDCSDRPVFLTDDRILTASCNIVRIMDLQGAVLKTITLPNPVSFAGVSQNGKRFAIQVASFSGSRSERRLKEEHFVVYSVDTAKPVAEVTGEHPAGEQSWTALSPDGSMIVVGSPVKLALYRLP